jgi:acyl dehydratase
MLDYEFIKSFVFPDVVQSYTERDSMLYALGLGFGANPLDEDELKFVYESGLRTVPTQAAVLGSPGFIWQNPVFAADWVKVVHGEQDIEWYRPLPAEATLVGRNRVASLTDKGAGKGAIARVVRDLMDQSTGELIAQVRQLTFLRGDGGYSQDSSQSDPPPAALPLITDEMGEPHTEVELEIVPQAALIYRLSGDRNPLHADPAVARKAGFDRPILHGLCTYGMAARALLRTGLGYDPSRLKRLAVRFTAPLFPGEAVRFQFWNVGSGRLAIRAVVRQRNVTVLNHGFAEIAVT